MSGWENQLLLSAIWQINETEYNMVLQNLDLFRQLKSCDFSLIYGFHLLWANLREKRCHREWLNCGLGHFLRLSVSSSSCSKRSSGKQRYTDRPNYIKVGRADILKEKSPIIWPQAFRYLSLQGEKLFSPECVDRHNRNFILKISFKAQELFKSIECL